MNILIVDATPVAWWKIWRPEPWFQAGAVLLKDKFDLVVNAYTCEDVYNALVKYKPDNVQIWGHGLPGQPVIGNKALSASHPSWHSVRGTVWFRSCLVAQGKKGHAFMNLLASQGISAIAHLSKINGLAHSYLVGVKKKEQAWWPTSLTPKSSNPFAPRTVLPIQTNLPSWTFDHKLD